MKTTERQ